VVLLTTNTLLAHIFAAAELDLRCTPRLHPAEPLPATLNPVTLDFAVTARAAPAGQ
jgi:hypothetical protein